MSPNGETDRSIALSALDSIGVPTRFEDSIGLD
jgi:hypothetical protein